MKTITGLLLLAFTASCLYADNQVVERKYRNKEFKDAHVGIVSLSVKGTYRLRFLSSRDLNEQQAMVRTSLLQWMPHAFQEASSCSRTEVCTSAVLDSVSPRRLELDHDESIVMNLPLRIHFQGKKETWPKHCLVMEITEVHDDLSTKYVDVTTVGGPLMIPVVSVKNKAPEECLHYSCNYAFIDCGSGALVCYGRVTAEGCGFPRDRDRECGVWGSSLRELAKQITDDSPFHMKELDASDFH
jgi:hypothetical protein